MVELRLVDLRDLLAHRRSKAVAKLRKAIRPRLDEIEVVAVLLLGLVAIRGVVGALGRVAVRDQVCTLLLEEVKLAPDDVLEGQNSTR